MQDVMAPKGSLSVLCLFECVCTNWSFSTERLTSNENVDLKYLTGVLWTCKVNVCFGLKCF